MQRRTWQFFRDFRGTYLFRNGTLGTNPYGAQCVNPPDDFWESMGIPAIAGNAVDWIGAEDAYRRWVPATTRTRLVHGDVCVFRPEWVGPNGHVSIVLDGSGSMVATLDQNWPLGSPVSEVWHHRASVAGVLRIYGNHG